MEDLGVMKSQFYEKVYTIKSEKGKNTQLFSRKDYYLFMEKVKISKQKRCNKTPEDYQRLSRYDILELDDTEKLIVAVKNEKDPIIFFTFLEEIFDIIHDCHISVGHGGRNKVMKELKSKYKNITVELVMVYLSLCETCKKKIGVPRKRISNLENDSIHESMTSEQSYSQCRLDIMDMQLKADGAYKFILVYEDHHTKFVQLRALKTGQIEEVVDHLIDIFTTFGAPCTLQSYNGEHFTEKVIEQVCSKWDGLEILVNKPEHSTEGFIEKANQDIEDLLTTWLEKNRTSNWSEGLKFVQLTKNQTYHTDLNGSPYEALFGCKAKIGLEGFLPTDMISEIQDEEDLKNILENASGKS